MHRRRPCTVPTLLLTLPLLLGAALPAAGHAQPTGLTVRVVAEESGKPLAGADLRLYLALPDAEDLQRKLLPRPGREPHAWTATDAAGRARIGSLPPDLPRTLIVSAPGRRTRVLPYLEEAEEEITVALEPGGILDVAVRGVPESAPGTPLELEIYGPGSRRRAKWESVALDRRGGRLFARLSGLPEGRHRLLLRRAAPAWPRTRGPSFRCDQLLGPCLGT